jgi:hypothetical protein
MTGRLAEPESSSASVITYNFAFVRRCFVNESLRALVPPRLPALPRRLESGSS